MEILTKIELEMRLPEIVEKIKNGAIFIYPTDTIYGIGCNALDREAVAKLRKLKSGREGIPFSVWVPSLKWIKDNCKISKKAEDWLKKFPGQCTLILPLKNKEAIADNVAPNIGTVGVRFPDHWFGEVVKLTGIPIITTSANKGGQPFMTRAEDLDTEIELEVEMMIYEGEKKARPSKIINVGKDEIKER